MGEVVNVLVAFAVIVFLFRWATSGNTPSNQSRQRSPAEVLGFRPKNVTQEMISTISNMFPDIPIENIRFDLLRSGSVEVTTNKILERGYLDAVRRPSTFVRQLLLTQILSLSPCLTIIPPTAPGPQPPTAYYTLYPRANATPSGSVGANAQHQGQQHAANKQPEKETLISRFDLQQRVVSEEEPIKEDDVGGKAVWEDSTEKREASLRERKARMILAARQRLLAQQQRESSGAPASSSGTHSSIQ